ncbi:ras and EF-hand domain-containing protein isoform X2 [Salarias fasciatus]|uniref:ras and EF-hand domain-containing protein isoform X2 n=1 Tax=Salarias fasciatus TaxID=181472 RepID=UPI00117693D3|nr:ras and EF-hand domain-containing protein-like isoform X2 [Salarias fasciatus]
MEPHRLRRLFSACDLNGSGRIEYEDFTAVCGELGVPETDTRALFDRFDAHKDGYIDFEAFASMFEEVSGTLDLAALGAGAAQTPCCGPGEEFVGRVDAQFLLSESLREQLLDLHQAIRSSGNAAVLELYEDMIQSLIAQSLDNRQTCEQLETSLKRVEEMNNSQLAELEDDMQQELCATEERVRAQEHRKMEGIMESMQRKHEDEVADLQAALDGLFKDLKDLQQNTSKDEVMRLKKDIGDLSQMNKLLRDSLLLAQTNMSVLQAELDKLKNMYAEQMAQRDREAEELRRMVLEFQSYSRQIRSLQEMNQRLYDSNDGLRSALASEMVAAKRRPSPQSEIPARRMKPLRQSTLIHSSSEHDRRTATFSRVATWADKYLDSGVFPPMDTAESSGSDYDYDSDDSSSSVETVHHSYSYVPSDVEVSEVKSEAAVSVAPSRTSSITSSLRRRLSAFSTKPVEADMEDAEEDPQVYRLVLAGDAGSGKSSFLLRLTLNEFRGDISTTLGVDFQMKKMLVDGEKTSLQIWDTAGQERFRSIARSYFRKAHGVLLLYDVGSESSFLNVRAWVDQIQDSTEEKIPMCVIGNKVDLREELPEGRCVSSLQGEKLAQVYGALFCETSAKEGTNVVEAVLHLAREVKKRVPLRQNSNSQVRLNPDSQKKTPNSCCGL